jgi:hypothetical protein
VNAAQRVRPEDAAGLRSFVAGNRDRCGAGLLLYDGDEAFWLTDEVLAVPWWRVV